MRRAPPPRALSLAFLVALLAGAAAEATVLRRLTLREVEAYAEQVFVGTVQSKRTVAGDPARNIDVYTEVTFENLLVLKGNLPRATVSYRFAGGDLGEGRRLTYAGMPEFRIGWRYVLFAAPGLDWICPAVGWWQGRYTVRPAPLGGAPTIGDSEGRPVYRFANGRPVTAPVSEEDAPLTLTAFLGVIQEIIERREELEDPVPEGSAEGGAR